MSLTRIQKMSVHLEGQAEPIFSEVTFDIGPRDRIGLIGPNGCGKTTLLKALSGELTPVAGEVIRSRQAEATGYMRQKTAFHDAWNVLNAALTDRPDLTEIRETMRRLEKRLTDPGEAAPDKTVIAYGETLDAYHQAGGYDIERTATDILFGLGFAEEDLSRPVTHLSSGQRTRVELARLLLQPTDLLLLDEPTNHLDIAGQDWIEEYLRRFQGSALIVSHDRYFLDRVVTRILELRRGRLKEYPGNYSDYAKRRSEEEESAWEAFEQAGREARRLRASLAERKRTARRVESRPTRQTYDPKHASFYRSKSAKVQKRAVTLEKRIDRQLEAQSAVKPFEEKQSSIKFPPIAETGPTVFHASDLSKRYGDKVLFERLSFQVSRGQRIAIVGRNGAGKTTLLNILAGKTAPDQGTLRVGSRARIGYYAQEREELNPERTILEEVMAVGGADETYARVVLGALLLRRNTVHDRIGVLSVGEQGRVALARIILSGANALLLDEPTNHLDIDGREAVESVLADFPGAVVFVSHDRRMIEYLADDVLDL